MISLLSADGARLMSLGVGTEKLVSPKIYKFFLTIKCPLMSYDISSNLTWREQHRNRKYDCYT